MLVLPSVWAEVPFVKLQKTTPVYAKPSDENNAVLYLQEGERVWPMGEAEDGFQKIKFKRKDKWKAGYVSEWDVSSNSEDEIDDDDLGSFGYGLGGMYSKIDQNGKSFSTDDQVHYITGKYQAQDFSPVLLVQYQQRNFWRLSVGYRQVNFTSSAYTDVNPTLRKSLSVNHKMVSGLLQKAWSWRSFYFGPGLELARSISTKIRMGTSDLPTGTESQPVWAGPQVFLGYSSKLGAHWLVYLEGRYEVIMNQSPTIVDIEGAFGFMYWP